MIITRNVVYTNLDNILQADVVEIDLKTKIQKYLCMRKTRR